MKKIGGFFELELNRGKEYHDKALRLNTGRNAFEYILRAKRYTKVFLPYYICQSVLEPIKKLGVEYSFYHINHNFEAEFDFTCLGESEVFLYVNYFGVCDSNVNRYVSLSKKLNFNICIDNTQSFYSIPHENVDTFYSARKFFGVPDGAYLYTNRYMNAQFAQETGYDKSTHLLKRIDLGPNKAYKDYKNVSEMHKNQDIKIMSNLSQSILSSINYPEIKEKRLTNFIYLNKLLKDLNCLSFDISSINVPMVYPLLVRKEGLRNHLISNHVYVATYWKDALINMKDNQFERTLVNRIIPLPIDQRYGIEEMEYMVDIIQKF